MLPDALVSRLQAGADLWINPEDRALSADEIARAVAAHRAEVLIVMATDRMDAGLLTSLPDSVRIVATYSVGHDHIDLDAARARGLVVLSTPDVLSDAVADMAMLLM